MLFEFILNILAPVLAARYVVVRRILWGLLAIFLLVAIYHSV